MDLLDVQHKHFPISHLSRASGTEDGAGGDVDEGIGHSDFKPYLLLETQLYGRAPVILDSLGLSAVSHDSGHSQSTDFGVVERLEDAVEPIGANDGDDEFHDWPRWSARNGLRSECGSGRRDFDFGQHQDGAFAAAVRLFRMLAHVQAQYFERSRDPE